MGLDYVVEDFEKRGIYSDNEGTPSSETLGGRKNNKVKGGNRHG